ncbi:hypothetical protein BURMUCGD2M_0756 [Burkholderia multivorans CGD2M]|nr:hypothetical protein BURMUCGD2M_0756 [Burkholderia multivorans CGD2M]
MGMRGAGALHRHAYDLPEVASQVAAHRSFARKSKPNSSALATLTFA